MSGKLTDKIVKDYEPASVYLAANAYYNWRRRPPFHRLFHVPAMLQDQRVQMTLMILKGMISSLSKFYVSEGESEEENESDVKRFLVEEIERFWRVGSGRVLSALEWGWFAAETVYKIDSKGRYRFDGFIDFRQKDCVPVTLDGEFVGFELRRGSKSKFIGGQKAFWHVHNRQAHPWWGESRLRGAFAPWLDKHDEGGANDARRLYYYKHVFQGETIYHPPGSHIDSQGNSTPNADLARRLVEKAKTGGVYVLPSQFDPTTKQRVWAIEDRSRDSAADDIRDYCRDLDREISEGMGLSEEIFQAAETGSGYSGRKIPETATRGSLTELVYWIIQDADQQIFRPLVKMNFGYVPDYEIIPFGLVETAMQEEEEIREIPEEDEAALKNKPA